MDVVTNCLQSFDHGVCLCYVGEVMLFVDTVPPYEVEVIRIISYKESRREVYQQLILQLFLLIV